MQFKTKLLLNISISVYYWIRVFGTPETRLPLGLSCAHWVRFKTMISNPKWNTHLIIVFELPILTQGNCWHPNSFLIEKPNLLRFHVLKALCLMKQKQFPSVIPFRLVTCCIEKNIIDPSGKTIPLGSVQRSYLLNPGWMAQGTIPWWSSEKHAFDPSGIVARLGNSI